MTAQFTGNEFFFFEKKHLFLSQQEFWISPNDDIQGVPGEVSTIQDLDSTYQNKRKRYCKHGSPNQLLQSLVYPKFFINAKKDTREF